MKKLITTVSIALAMSLASTSAFAILADPVECFMSADASATAAGGTYLEEYNHFVREYDKCMAG